MTRGGPRLEPGISVVVPVYNAAETLPELLDRLSTVLEALGRSFEAVLVNDGSTDRSWERIRELAARHPWIHGINLMRNYGQHNALLCGIRAARFATTVTIDDDLQHPPEEIPKLLAKLAEGHDVVYGEPHRKHHPLGHRIGARILALLLGVALGAKSGQISSAFRAFRTVLRGAFEQTRSPWVVLDLYLTWATQDFVSVAVRHEPRQVGRATYSTRRRFVQALDQIVGFSTLPLKIASWIGFFFTVFGIAILSYVITVFYVYDTVPGFAFIASTIAIFSGAQLFALGVLGEYMARMFERIMDRPAYAIDETTGSPARDGQDRILKNP